MSKSAPASSFVVYMPFRYALSKTKIPQSSDWGQPLGAAEVDAEALLRDGRDRETDRAGQRPVRGVRAEEEFVDVLLDEEARELAFHGVGADAALGGILVQEVADDKVRDLVVVVRDDVPPVAQQAAVGETSSVLLWRTDLDLDAQVADAIDGAEEGVGYALDLGANSRVARRFEMALDGD